MPLEIRLDNGSRMRRESHVRFCERLQAKFLRSTYHNAVSESFFHTLKTELVHHQTYQTRAEAKPAIFEYIEVFYNRERLHSSNGYWSPVDFELQHKAA